MAAPIAHPASSRVAGTPCVGAIGFGFVSVAPRGGGGHSGQCQVSSRLPCRFGEGSVAP